MAANGIVGRQIANGTILDANIAAGAAIASSKLADGANFIKKDGSVSMTGALSLGNNKITNLATPSSSSDAATKGYVDTAISSINSMFSSKSPAAAATNSNVNVSNPGTAVFDGVTLTSGQALLLLGQSTNSQNGLYVFNGSGVALTRHPDMNTWAEVPGALITVSAGGSTYANTIWLCGAANSGTLETTTITFTQVNAATGLNSSNFVWDETPSGSINGSNTTFTLANSPTSGTVRLYVNGVRLRVGSGNDYTISGSTITMLYALGTGEYLTADYMK